LAGLVEERKVGGEETTYVTKCKNPKAVSVILRGGTDHVVDNVETAFEDSTRVVAVVVEDGEILAGGGSPEVELSLRLQEYAATLKGREQLAVMAFAEALEIIPRTLAENAGLDPIDKLVELRSQHERGVKTAGLNVYTGEVIDMWKEGVIEPVRIKTQALNSAVESSVMILRIDDVISSTRSPDMGPEGMPPGGMPPGGMPPGGMPDMDF
jgi:chaperonin GroEL (HSP60 family)